MAGVERAVGPNPPTDFCGLYSDHHRWLRGWLMNKLGCTERAADLAQDTYVRILQHSEKTGELPQIREPRAYLSTVAGRLVYDFFRRQSLERAYLESLQQLPEAAVPSAEEQHLICEALNELDSMLDSLKPEVRQVFLLHQLEGLTYKAIAQQLGISDRTVKRYMAQAFEECILVMA